MPERTQDLQGTFPTAGHGGGTGGGPLAGIRVLDLTSVVLGPLATQILGDYGADIIKVEAPEGDLMRANGVSVIPGLSSIFLAINRNKRSLSIDLKTPEGVQLLRRLLPTVDVFVHNMRVAAVERLGFGYDAVRELAPGIVYCVATGFGQDGPHKDKPAFDDIIQAACGLVGVNTAEGQAPDYVKSLIADKTTGMALVNAVLAGLVHRLRTGRGQHVEVPMLETMTAFVLAEHLGGLTFRPSTVPAGYVRVMGGGRRAHRTSDGYMAALPYTAEHWSAFFAEVGRQDLAEKFDVTSRQSRNARIRELYDALASIMCLRTTAQWMEICERLDVPATPIYSLDDLPSHPHLAATGLFEDAQHPVVGSIRQVRPPVKFSDSPAGVRMQAPTVGQHTDEILREAGLSNDEIDALAARRVVVRS